MRHLCKGEARGGKGNVLGWRLCTVMLLLVVGHCACLPACLLVQLPWDAEEANYTTIQTVRAAADFYRKPWFDCVTVHGNEGGQEVVWYAQLRSMFKSGTRELQSRMSLTLLLSCAQACAWCACWLLAGRFYHATRHC